MPYTYMGSNSAPRTSWQAIDLNFPIKLYMKPHCYTNSEAYRAENNILCPS